MDIEKRNEYFWQQYYGIAKAIDLPQEYKILDERIFCVNTNCFRKDSCLFFNRSYGLMSPKLQQKAVMRDQKGWKREAWNKFFPLPDYRMASFGFFVEEDGLRCKYFQDK